MLRRRVQNDGPVVFSVESCMLMLNKWVWRERVMCSLGAMLNESLDRYLQLRITSFFNLFRSTVLYHAEVSE